MLQVVLLLFGGAVTDGVEDALEGLCILGADGLVELLLLEGPLVEDVVHLGEDLVQLGGKVGVQVGGALSVVVLTGNVVVKVGLVLHHDDASRRGDRAGILALLYS